MELQRRDRRRTVLLALALARAAALDGGGARVVVFGGSGRVGKVVCSQLINKGCDVVSLSRSGRPSAGAWADAVSWVRADAATDADAVAAAVEGADAVVSCVGGFKGAKASPTGTGDIPARDRRRDSSVRGFADAALGISTWHPAAGPRRRPKIRVNVHVRAGATFPSQVLFASFSPEDQARYRPGRNSERRHP